MEESPTNMWTPYGGRRFVMAMYVITISAVLCAMQVVSGETFSVIVLGTAGVFVGANTYQKREAVRADKEVRVAEIRTEGTSP